MPLITQYRIYRQDLKNNPEVFFVFGDNVNRQGFGGQAAEMRGEPNAIGVVTKWEPDNKATSFFCDTQFYHICLLISYDLSRIEELLKEGVIVVLPSDGLGTGLSQLPTRAPRIHAWLTARLSELHRFNNKS